MRYPVEAVLSSLEVLGDEKPKIYSHRTCKMCGGYSGHLEYVDFNKTCNGYSFGRSGILVEYFRCSNCEHAFTDFFDDWTTEEFGQLIYNDDYVKADPDYTGLRPKQMAEYFSETLISGKDRTCLDYGGGAGVFADSMNEKGFKFDVYDPFSRPDRPDGKYDIITAFEVIEHSPRPLDTLRDMLNFLTHDGCILISQTITPDNIATLGRRWWYMAPRNGHVSFYSDVTMQWFCDTHDLVYGRSDSHLLLHRRSAHPTVRAIKASLGIVTHEIKAGAPARGYSAIGWHEIETDHDVEFRWSGQQVVTLGVFPLYPGMNVVEIPFVSTATPELLHDATIEVDGIRHRAYSLNGALRTAFLHDKPGHQTIILRTGPLASPGDLGINSDMRMLGVAVVSNQFLHGRT